MRTYLRRGAAIALVCSVATACTEKLKEQLKDKVAQNQAADDANGNPCSLLDSAEVAAAIGPLAGPPYRGDPIPDESSETCRYDSRDYRRIRVDVDWSGGAMVMKMASFGRSLTDKALRAETDTGKVAKAGDALQGDWDQLAMSPASCCSFEALKGDRHVQLDWTGTRLTLQQAAALLETAIKRLDHPLAVSDTVGLAAARARWAAMAKDSALDACSLVSQADAEAIIGAPLSSPPDHGTAPGGVSQQMCFYRTPMPGMPNRSYEYSIEVHEWNNGHDEFASDQYVINGATNGMRRQLSGVTGAKDTLLPPAEPAGPWDDVGSSVSGGYEAVKGPILLIGAAMGDHDKLRALLAKAVSNLK
ncbi:MAG: hypothetical protein ACREOJ_08530 [Gemmatimonadaceae bacterium]